MGKKRLADNKDDMEEGEHSDMDKSSKMASRTANLVRENNVIHFLTLSIKSGKSQNITRSKYFSVSDWLKSHT